MKLNDEQKEVVIKCGAFGYDAEKLANILELSVEVVEIEIKKKTSDIAICYKLGIDRFDFSIDSRLLQMAQSGDIKALEKLEFRKKMRKTKR